MRAAIRAAGAAPRDPTPYLEDLLERADGWAATEEGEPRDLAEALAGKVRVALGELRAERAASAVFAALQAAELHRSFLLARPWARGRSLEEFASMGLGRDLSAEHAREARDEPERRREVLPRIWADCLKLRVSDNARLDRAAVEVARELLTEPRSRKTIRTDLEALGLKK